MSDERRWVDSDGVPEDVAELLRSAKKARPIAAAPLARSRRKVAALGAVPVAAGSLLWMNAALGAVLGAAVTTVAVVVPRYTAPAETALPAPVHSSSPARSVRDVGPVRPVTPTVVEDGPAVAVESAGAPASVRGTASAPRGDQVAAVPSVQRETAPDAGADLAREARLLERARGAVTTDPGGALVVLTEHERAFPRGGLVLERELLAVDALLRLGRRADAEARARSLRARAPGSLYTRRLEHLLGGTP